MADFNIMQGLQVGYDALPEKYGDTVYICTDTGRCYLGTKLLSPRLGVTLTGGMKLYYNGNDVTASSDIENIMQVSAWDWYGSQSAYDAIVASQHIQEGVLYHVDVQADWSITDPTHLGFIKNKPTIPSVGNSKVFYGTCNTAAATEAKDVTCSAFASADLVNGVIVNVKFDNKNSGAVASLTLNVNQTGAYPIKKIYGSSSSNAAINNLSQAGELGADMVIPFIFTGDYWLVAGLDMNQNTTYTLNYSVDSGQYRSGGAQSTDNNVISRYSLIMQKPDFTWEKITAINTSYSTGTSKNVNTSGFLLGQIRYYGTTTVKGYHSLLATNTCYVKAASLDMRYSTNCGSTIPSAADVAGPLGYVGDYVYLVGTLHSDGLFYLDTTQWWTNTLPNTNDGKLYVRLGLVLENNSTDHYASYNMSLLEYHPIYYHDGTGVREYHYHENDCSGQGYGTIGNTTVEGEYVIYNVTLSGYELKNGYVTIKCTYGIATGGRFNINSKGAKPIYFNGSAITSGTLNSGDIALFYYDGVRYHLVCYMERYELVTSISSNSTNSQYPSAKCVYDMIGDIETLLAAI